MIADANREAQLVILEHYFKDEYGDMLSFATYLLNSQSLAEVAVQDTFVFALENTDKLLDSPKPVGWLYNVMKNIIKHIQRDQQVLIKRLISFDESTIVLNDPKAEEAANLLSIARDDPNSKLLHRFYIEGYSLKELAQELGITIGACKMRIKRAKEQMQKRYDLLE